jgi:outer membrane protein TolC
MFAALDGTPNAARGGKSVPAQHGRTNRRSASALQLVVFCGLVCASFSAQAKGQRPKPPVADDSTPPATPVSDPLLAPPPVAPQLLRSWQEAFTLLRSHSPDLLTAFDNVLRAEGQSRIALAGALPTLTAFGTYTHQFLTAVELGPAPPGVVASTLPSDAFSGNVTLTQPVVAPRAFYGVGTAARAVDAAKASLADKRRTLAAVVVNAMLATLAAERVAALNRIGLTAALERLSLTQLRQKFGTGTLLDSERAEQDAVSARSLVITGDEALRRAREALGLLLGSSTAMAAPGDLNLGEFEQAVAQVCHSNAGVEKRADVVAARIRLAIAERGVSDVWLQFAPTLTFQSQLNATDHPVYGYPNTTWSMLGVLSVPLWDGGVRYGELKDTRAQVDQAAQALTAARISALIEIAQSDRAVTVVANTRDFAQSQRDLANSVDRRTREAYAKGLGTSLDLVTSGAALRQAEINLAVLQLQAAQARVDAVLANADCVF